MPLLHATDASFDQEVLQDEDLVLVDFWAPWCGPCKMIGPVLEELDSHQKIKIVKINVDENPQTASHFGVRSVPTLMLFKAGKTIDTKVGLVSIQELQDWLAQAS